MWRGSNPDSGTSMASRSEAMNFDPKLVFALLGPVFLVLGGLRWLRAGRVVPQARAWLIVGIVFCATAAWLASR